MASSHDGIEEGVYATLLLSDTYLPGALVLAHSLRDAGTRRKLAVLVTLDTVSAEAITQLKAVYDHVIPVPRIKATQPDNLQLMNRPDLHSALTKINLWKQTQFRQIVYIDADVVAYRAPDELFDITHPFSAAPDIGWPDLFNTGVMVLKPNMGDYYAMMAMAERNISFDGADQGLLNIHFRNNYNRISFTYNVTPSAHYQYIPAYRHFQSSINMVHFIGPDKPWFQGRHAGFGGGSPYDDMVGRWWAVYDRHYRENASEKMSPAPATKETPSKLVQYLTKGEFRPEPTGFGTTGEHLEDVAFAQREELGSEQSRPAESAHGHGASEHNPPVHGRLQQDEYGDGHHAAHDFHDEHNDTQQEATQQSPGAIVSSHYATDESLSANRHAGSEAEARVEQSHEEQGTPHRQPSSEPEQPKPAPHVPTYSSWDAQRHAPPPDSQPEAANFPHTVYEMSQDAAPFVPPQRYPSPPRDMWYEVPKAPPSVTTEKPKAIFPWEVTQPRPSRVFANDTTRPSSPDEGDKPTDSTHEMTPDTSRIHVTVNPSATEASTTESAHESEGPVTPTIQVTGSDPWTTYTRTNAWDNVPEITQYVDAVQQHRRSRSRKAPGRISLPESGAGAEQTAWQAHGSKVTDFPSEEERPSLPVTPAPIRRPKFWGGGAPGFGDGNGDEDDPMLSAAKGVPEQSAWDPVAQLQLLAKQQSEALLEKLGSSRRDSSDLPPRHLPFGSEELRSPTYVAQTATIADRQHHHQSVESVTQTHVTQNRASGPPSGVHGAL